MYKIFWANWCWTKQLERCKNGPLRTRQSFGNKDEGSAGNRFEWQVRHALIPVAHAKFEPLGKFPARSSADHSMA